MYTFLGPQGVIRKSDSTFIPNDPGNLDWRAYLEWEASGGVADTYAQASTSTVKTISRFQAKAVLQRHGLLQAVEDYATAPTAHPLVKLAWAEAVEVKRSSLMVMNIAIILDLSQSQLDNLFAEAATIEV